MGGVFNDPLTYLGPMGWSVMAAKELGSGGGGSGGSNEGPGGYSPPVDNVPSTFNRLNQLAQSVSNAQPTPYVDPRTSFRAATPMGHQVERSAALAKGALPFANPPQAPDAHWGYQDGKGVQWMEPTKSKNFDIRNPTYDWSASSGWGGKNRI